MRQMSQMDWSVSVVSSLMVILLLKSSRRDFVSLARRLFYFAGGVFLCRAILEVWSLRCFDSSVSVGMKEQALGAWLVFDGVPWRYFVSRLLDLFDILEYRDASMSIRGRFWSTGGEAGGERSGRVIQLEGDG